MTALPYVVGLLAFVFVLGIVIERVLARFGIRPQEPTASRNPLVEIADAWSNWAKRRRRDE